MNTTKHKEINDLLQQLLTQVQSILAEKFIGMYVGGSLANGNFNYETSDIDCYVITKSGLSKKVIKNIEEMHKKLYSGNLKHAKKIEASYIPQKDLLHFNPSGMRPYFNEGCYYFGEYGSNYIIELHVLREKGISILGPDIKKLIKEISIQDLTLAIHKNLHDYWEATLSDFSKFSRSDYQAFAILTMCRTLYSLETGAITSKIEAAQWALQRLDNSWKNLIELAIAWRPEQEINKSDETMQFVKYVIRKSHDY
jgi:aminoglycoside adenylyltransferase-like protein/nucleotidyltransferase-like protein